MEGSILAQRERVSLGNGMALRLLSALEVLQARREAGELAGTGSGPCAPTPVCWPGPWSRKRNISRCFPTDGRFWPG